MPIKYAAIILQDILHLMNMLFIVLITVFIWGIYLGNVW